MVFRTFVENSGLSQEDKNLWFSFLEKLDDTQLKILEDFAEGKEENLKLLTENIKAKVEALKNQDEKMLEKIIKNEE